jgi:cytoskeletal protein RodZ
MSEESPVDFGTMFRQARERRGVSLQQVAAVTKISARVLDALERNDVSKLPGGIFSRAFVRSYAREIGLDPEMAIERFTAEFPDESGKEQLPSAKEAEDIEAYESGRRVATTVAQLLGLSIVVIAVVVFALNSRACPKSAATPPAASAPAAPAPAPVTPLPATRRPPSAEEPAATPKETTAGAPPAQTPESPAGRAGSTAQATAPIRLSIAAQAECWLMVKVDKDVVFERILRAGERLYYEASASVTLSAGNAGGLSLTINGKPARPLGTPGQIVTATITLDTLASFLQ